MPVPRNITRSAKSSSTKRAAASAPPDVITTATPGALLKCSAAALAERPEGQHVVMTGRNALPMVIEAADLVTEMTMVKHPFRDGIKAQPGVEF